jgi:hypothetical protein
MIVFGYTTRRLPRVNEKNAQSWIGTAALTAVEAVQAPYDPLTSFLNMA